MAGKRIRQETDEKKGKVVGRGECPQNSLNSVGRALVPPWNLPFRKRSISRSLLPAVKKEGDQ